jgi:endonuclease/exonuclease/phosphatase family metal-dependent hydrolase
MWKKTVTTITVLCLFGLGSSCVTVKQSYDSIPGPSYSGNYANGTPEYEGTLRAVSYNIQWAEKLEMAVDELGSENSLQDADVILLQETHTSAADAIARRLNYNYVFYPTAMYRKSLEFGNAVLSRWPIKEHWKVVLPHENPLRKMHRIAVMSVLEVAGSEVLVVNVHTHTLLFGNEVRLDQMEHVAENLHERFSFGIVGGDFNTDSEYIVREMERIFSKAGFTRATKGIGPTHKQNLLGLGDLELDHIFVKGMDVVSVGKVTDADASDHLPIWLSVKLDSLGEER